MNRLHARTPAGRRLEFWGPPMTTTAGRESQPLVSICIAAHNVEPVLGDRGCVSALSRRTVWPPGAVTRFPFASATCGRRPGVSPC